MEQDKTCYYTCTCKPWDMSQPLEAMHRRSSPWLADMVSTSHKRESNRVSLTRLFGADRVPFASLAFFPCRNWVLPPTRLLLYPPCNGYGPHHDLFNMIIIIIRILGKINISQEHNFINYMIYILYIMELYLLT